ncbi:MAG: sensor histidine kinase, partial [Faecalimonas sp.]
IPVAEELELVEFYLYLQNSRFQDKITYEIICPEEKVKENLIPRLLIEPLVENAVSHGLEPKQGSGKVQVILYEQNKRLHIIVEDDGVGFEEEDVETVREKEGHTHTGLENTKRLLYILYGENHTWKVTGKKGEGTTVEIVIPSERRADDVERDGSR